VQRVYGIQRALDPAEAVSDEVVQLQPSGFVVIN
jgi:5-deoxy-D-glucuronate isomerase